MPRRVVITGMGVVSPLGLGAQTVFERWLAGEVGITDGRGEYAEFDAQDLLLSRRERRFASRYMKFAIVAAQEALEQAGWTERLPVDAERIACIVGTCYGGLDKIEHEAGVLAREGGHRVDALATPIMLPDSACGAVSMRYGLRGPSQCIASACAAGADSIGAAMRMIRSGEADAAVAGGADACLTDLTDWAAKRLGATSRSGVSRPFDVRRDGFVGAEGAGVLTLEEAGVAQRRGARVLAEVLGYGASTDAYDMTAPAPDGDQAARAIKLALGDAHVKPADVAYINAHGTATPLNDKMETQAIKRAFGDDVARRIPISSTKSAIGHTMGAAGAIELVTAIHALRQRVVPPTLGLEQQDPELDLDYVPGQPRPIASANGDRLIAVSNSFGFGGHNSVLCVGV